MQHKTVRNSGNEKNENEKQLLERLIECKILNDYLQEIIQEQDEEITEYENNSDMEE